MHSIIDSGCQVSRVSVQLKGISLGTLIMLQSPTIQLFDFDTSLSVVNFLHSVVLKLQYIEKERTLKYMF